MTSLHHRALQLVREYKRVEYELLCVLQQIDDARVFRELGYASLFDYCVRALQLPEGTAYNFINVARRAREVPELGEAVRSGALSVAKARKIAAVVTKENVGVWVGKAGELTQHALELEIAKESPAGRMIEFARAKPGDRVELKFSVDAEVYAELKRVVDLESKRVRRPVKMEHSLDRMIELYLRRYDPLLQHTRERRNKSDQQFSRTVGSKLRKLVLKRDQGRCQYKNCGHSRWTEIHHIVPRAHGGAHTLENLVTFCFSHHRMLHEQAAQASSAPAASCAAPPASARPAKFETPAATPPISNPPAPQPGSLVH